MSNQLSRNDGNRCGFFCRLKKVFRWVSENIPGRVGEIAGYAVDGMEALGVEGRISDPTLSMEEENILNNWEQNYLIPFSLKVFAIFNSNIFKSSLSEKTRMQFANEFVLRVESFNRYYLTNDLNGLSPTAIEFRKNYIIEYFKPFIAKIFDEMTFPFGEVTIIQDYVINNDITPVNTKNTTENMSFSTSVFNITGNTEDITPSVVTQQNNQPEEISVVTPSGSVINTTNTISEPKEDNMVKILLFSAFAFLGLRYAFKDDVKE